MKIFLSLLLLAAFPLSAAPYRPGELLVRYLPNPGASALKAEALRLGKPAFPDLSGARRALDSSVGAVRLSGTAGLDGLFSKLNVALVKLPKGLDPEAARALYLRSGLVAQAEPDYILRAYSPCGAGTFNYPSCPFLLQYQWYIPQIHDDQAHSAFASVNFPGSVLVAVCDTGLNESNQDLSNAASGWKDFVNGLPTAYDDEGHGSHVSSIILANDTNMAGIAYGVGHANIKILPVKVLDSGGSGTIDQIAQGIMYAADQGAKVINLSLGSTSKSDTLQQAVDYATNLGVLVVAASGNVESGESADSISYPAGYSDVLSVGALDNTGNRSYYSYYGKVDLCAPGGAGTCGTTSCQTPSFVDSCDASEILAACKTGTNDYSSEAGTSFACPMVVATAALLLAQDPTRSATELTRILESTTQPTALGSGYQQQVGWGELDVYKALTATDSNSGYNNPGTGFKVYNWPNPFNPDKDGPTHLTFILDSPRNTEVRVFDASGDPVFDQKLDASQTHTGLNFVDWNGRNGNGATVANGVYILTVVSGGRKGVNRIAVIR